MVVSVHLFFNIVPFSALGEQQQPAFRHLQALVGLIAADGAAVAAVFNIQLSVVVRVLAVELEELL